MTEDKTYFIADRIKSGDATAFRGLFRMHYPSLLAFVDGFVKDKEVAEDIVQNVFMKVWMLQSHSAAIFFYYAKERFAIGSEKRLLSRDL